MYHILCFGDSNTHGYNGETHGRFGWDKRWTGILARRLGPDWLLTEEGLCGRTTGLPGKGERHQNPVPYLAPCILSHSPLDLIVVMLGTNDTKAEYHASPEEITQSMRKLIQRIKAYARLQEEKCAILLVSPVPMDSRAVVSGGSFTGQSVENSRQLPSLYRELARQLGIHFLDAGQAGVSLCSDGCHLSEEGHRQFAEALEEKIREIFPSAQA